MQTHKLDFHSTFRTLCSFRPPSPSPSSTPPDSGTEPANASTETNTKNENETEAKEFVARLAANAHDAPADATAFESDWKRWLAKYGTRISSEVSEGLWSPSSSSSDPASKKENAWTAREGEMRLKNPRFVLRQWVLEEIIKRVQDDPGTGKRALAKVHQVRPSSSIPFTSPAEIIAHLALFFPSLWQMATNPYEGWGGEFDGRAEGEMSEEEREERRFCGLGAKRFVGFQCSCSS